MATRDSVQKELAALASLRADPGSEESQRRLRRVLASASSAVVAKAAAIVGEAHLYDLVADLVEAFPRFLKDSLKTDPGCVAKTAIVVALYELEVQAGDVYLQALRHVQPEPAFGGPIDSAVELRCAAAVALVENRHPSAILLAAELLADSEPGARRGAIRALRASNSTAAIALLRFKALSGDRELEVMDECLQGLIELSPDSISFVARFLQDQRASLAAVAALALGGSRADAALPFLRDAWDARLEPEVKRAVLDAAAMLRTPAALDFMIALISAASEQAAVLALEALAAYAYDPELRRRLEQAVEARKSAVMKESFARLFV